MGSRGAMGCALAVVAASLCLASAAFGRAFLPPGHHVWAGLTGGTSITPYQSMVGKHPAVFEEYMTWDTSSAWLRGADSGFRSRLGLEISTAAGYGKPGVITPQQIAQGRSDRFLVDLGENLYRSRRIVYVRLMGEMDAWWNAYSAFNADGSYRGSADSPENFVQAWRRSVIILRGGAVSSIDARLRRLGLPALRVKTRRGARLARPKVAFLWVPQDAGSPEIAADRPGVYWPGGAYVDWVGTDFYASYPNFSLLNSYYDSTGGKPFVISEWALYGSDDPRFVDELFAWVHSHPRVRMLDYYQGFQASSPANLHRYPRSRAALRHALRSRTFLAYPPEYAHPGRHRHAGPPHNPKSGPPPSNPPILSSPGGVPQLCVPLTTICLKL